MKRSPIPKRVRFEVFLRDDFTCQYCGSKAPEVRLHCDHVNPVINGGTNHPNNLKTACEDCNLGKGAKVIADSEYEGWTEEDIRELKDRQWAAEVYEEVFGLSEEGPDTELPYYFTEPAPKLEKFRLDLQTIARFGCPAKDNYQMSAEMVAEKAEVFS